MNTQDYIDIVSEIPTNILQGELDRRQERADKLASKEQRAMEILEQIRLEKEKYEIKPLKLTRRISLMNAKNLIKSIKSVTEPDRQYTISEITNAVLNLGYKTRSASFRTVVNQCLLTHNDLFKRVDRGIYVRLNEAV